MCNFGAAWIRLNERLLVPRYNYAWYWSFRGWLSPSTYAANWFRTGGPDPTINNPEIAAQNPYNAIDTAGFYSVKTRIQHAADQGVT